MTVVGKKKLLLKYAKKHNIEVPKGYHWWTNRIGRHCVALIQRVQMYNNLKPTGKFSPDFLDVLDPERINRRFRDKMVKSALKDVGVREVPLGSNWGPRVSVFLKAFGLGPGNPWCQAFDAYHAFKSGFLKKWMPSAPAYCPSWVALAKRKGYHVKQVPKNKAKRGDFIYYDYEHNGVADHVEILLWKVGPLSRFLAVGGNEQDRVIKGTHLGGDVLCAVRLSIVRGT